MKGCFKKFNTEENLALHKKYFHNEEKYISLSLKKFKNLKNKIQKMNFDSKNKGIEDTFQDKRDEYVLGKYTFEDKNGNIIKEKMFLSFKHKLKEGEYNSNTFNEKDVIGYISNGRPWDFGKLFFLVWHLYIINTKYIYNNISDDLSNNGMLVILFVD